MSTTETRDPQIAQTILAQLGGTGRLHIMTGANTFVDHGDGVSFRIGRNAKGVNYVRVRLDHGSDTYDVEFLRIWGTKVTPKGRETGIYCDQLRPSIERNTELYLSL